MATESSSRLRNLKTIVASMAVETVVISAIAIIVVANRTTPPNHKQATNLLIVLAVLSVSAVPAYFLLRRSTVLGYRVSYAEEIAEGRQAPDLLGTLGTLTIIGSAMADGIGLLGAAIYWGTGVPWSLIATGLALLALGLQYPTAGRVWNFAKLVQEGL